MEKLEIDIQDVMARFSQEVAKLTGDKIILQAQVDALYKRLEAYVSEEATDNSAQKE